jgi:hypothetical protein
MTTFTAVYSRLYQSEQKCRCDNDHDQCSTNSIYNIGKSSNSAYNGMLKRSRRIRRVCKFFFSSKKQKFSFMKDAHSKQQTKNDTKDSKHRNSFHRGQTLRFHVAKKSPTTLQF